MPKVILILLHGTFESKAAWTFAGSEFAEELRRTIPVSELLIERFEMVGAKLGLQQSRGVLSTRNLDRKAP
jgi:hypothetical protein